MLAIWEWKELKMGVEYFVGYFQKLLAEREAKTKIKIRIPNYGIILPIEEIIRIPSCYSSVM